MVMSATTSSTRLSGMVRAALAVAGIVAVLSGGLLFLTAGSASSVPTSTETPCVPSDAWTETTDWVLTSPGEGWRQVDQRTVTDQPAWTEEVVVGWQHWSWTGGPLDPGVVPPLPTGPDDPSWQPNTEQEPHQNNPNVTWLDDTGWGLHYTSHGSSGLADWFYFQRLTERVEHPAVTHEEFTFAFDHPAVVCPTQPPTTQPPTTQPPTTQPPTTQPPTTQPPTTQPPTAQPPEVLPTTATPTAEPSDEPSEEATEEPTAQPDDTEVLGVEAAQPPSPQAQVPTVVDAGLASVPGDGTPAARQWGLVLVAGGMVLLASSGGLLVAARRA